jgi:hypothetical protein
LRYAVQLRQWFKNESTRTDQRYGSQKHREYGYLFQFALHKVMAEAGLAQPQPFLDIPAGIHR